MIINDLNNLKDPKYAEFQSKLTPNIKKELFIGVRVPILRTYAKKIKDSKEANDFLSNIPHKYYDENMLHSLLLNEIKDYNLEISYLEKFLPYIDNWAVCDILSPKIFKKNKDKLIIDIKRWINSKNTYTVRFAIEMLMSHYLDDDFNKDYLYLVANIRSDEYYINMMIAWYFATSLAKKWESALSVLENNLLDEWTHNKTIQKAVESYRITPEQKTYLKSLKK